MKQHTFNSVHELIQSGYESELPDKVLQVVRAQLEGKTVNVRHLELFPGGSESWRIVKNYGWTALERIDQKDGGSTSMIIQRTEKGAVWNASELERENPAYFEARRKRNHQRMEVMNTKKDLETVADVMNEVEEAREKLLAAVAKLEELTKYGERFEQDSYKFRQACGLYNNKSGKTLIDSRFERTE